MTDLLKIFNVKKEDIYMWVKYNEFPSPVHVFKDKMLYSKRSINEWAERNVYLWKKKSRKP